MAIFLTGFMGTGKSAVGRALAVRLGKPFIDLDAEVERRAGMSIARIFAEAGESHFRGLEAARLVEVAPLDAVIATGGGAFVAAANRDAMRAHGSVICLTADVDEILRRTAQDTTRPLLTGDDREARVRRLLAERADAYAQADYRIDTTRKPIAWIVERIVAFLDAGAEDASSSPRTREDTAG